MPNLAKYVAALEVENSKYLRGLDQANKKLTQFERNNKASLSAIETQFKKLGASVNSAVGHLKGLVATYVGIRGLEELSRAVYENTVLWQGMQYTLEAGGLSAAEAGKELDSLKGTAMRLGIAVQGSGEAFARFILTGTASNIPLSELNNDFEAITGTMRIFHLGSQQARRSWLALSEIMSMGTVKSQQFTQQLGRDWPGIGVLIAKTMFQGDHSLERFREAMSRGQVSARDFMGAFRKLMDDPSMKGALSGAVNSIQAAVGRLQTSASELFDQSSNPQALDTLTGSIDSLAKTLSDPSVKQGLDNLVIGLAKAAEWGIKAAAAIGRLGQYIGENIAASVHGPDTSLGQLEEKLRDINWQIDHLQQPSTNLGRIFDKILGNDPKAQIKKLQEQRDAIQKLIDSEKSIRYAVGSTPSVHVIPPQTEPPIISDAEANKLAAASKKAHEALTAQDTLLRKGLAGPQFPIEPGLDELAAQRSMTIDTSKQFAELRDSLKTQNELVAESYEKRKKIILDNTEDGSLQQRELLKRLQSQTQKELGRGYQQLGESLGQSLQNAIGDYLSGIETDWRGLLRRMAIEAAESQIFSALAGLGGPVGQVAKFLGFGGARAAGGPTVPGKAYLVGEHGPELFEPHVMGSIVPNGGKGININVDARGATDPNAVAAAIQRAVVAAVNISDSRVSTRLAMLSRPRMA